MDAEERRFYGGEAAARVLTRETTGA